ncbi:MAG TPA: permease-like cell division protein FtsX [Candidatus Dormibacteraeota bacterium]|nr:permease-like cell division protein FtsX [Candidatus Dormibacteraeota bacterium]
MSHHTADYWPVRYAQSVLGYCWRCWRSRTYAWIATVAAVTVLLALAASAQLIFLVGQRSLNHQLNAASQIQVFLDDGATPDQVSALEQALRGTKGVKQVSYFSKAQALAAARKDSSLSQFTDFTSGNPYPASLVVDMSTPQAAARVIATAKGQSAVDPKVPTSYTPAQASQLQAALSIAGAIIVGLALLALAVAGFVGLILMRGELRSRRAELRILALVGTPRVVIRLPVLIEALSIAVVATLGAAICLRYTQAQVLPAINSNLPFLQLRSAGGDWTSIVAVTLAASVLIFAGSSLLVRLPR